MMFLPTRWGPPTTTVRFRTTDGNDQNPAWTMLSELPGFDGSDNRFWHMVLAVDQKNSDTVYTNGHEPILVGSKDGGTPWSDPIKSGEDVVNSFYDDPPTSPNSDPSPIVLVGDRGIQVSPNAFDSIGTNNFSGKRGNLGTFLVYNTAVDALNPSNVFAVSQDQLANMQRAPGSLAWNYLAVGNELGRMIVNPTNSQIVYSFRQITEKSGSDKSFIQVSTNGGQTWTPIVNGLDPNQFPQTSNGSGVGETDYNAFTLDPKNPNHVLVGAQGVWEATFQSDLSKITWTEINSQIVDANGGGPGVPAQVCALAVAPSNHNIIYAATDDSKIWRIDRSGTAGWKLASGGLPVPQGMVENLTLSIDINPKNPNYVTINTDGQFRAAGRV